MTKINLAQKNKGQGSHTAREGFLGLLRMVYTNVGSCCIAYLSNSKRQLKCDIWKLFLLMNQTLHMP